MFTHVSLYMSVHRSKHRSMHSPLTSPRRRSVDSIKMRATKRGLWGADATDVLLQAEAVSSLSDGIGPMWREQICNGGVLPSVFAVRRDGDDAVKIEAARSLARAVSDGGAERFGSELHMQLLAEMIRENNDEIRIHTAQLIRAAAAHSPAARRAFVRAKGVEPLVYMLKIGGVDERLSAAGALWCIADDANARAEANAHGAVPALAKMLLHAPSAASAETEIAAGALSELTANAAAAAAAIEEQCARWLLRAVALTGDGDGARANALRALVRIAEAPAGAEQLLQMGGGRVVSRMLAETRDSVLACDMREEYERGELDEQDSEEQLESTASIERDKDLCRQVTHPPYWQPKNILELLPATALGWS